MNISKFLFEVAFLLLPGIIGISIYHTLTGKKNKKDWEDFTQIFIFSLISYIVLGFFYSVNINKGELEFCYQVVPTLDYINNINNTEVTNIAINWADILWSSLIGIILGLVATVSHTYKLLNRFGNWIKITNRYGDEDLWDLFHNNPEKNWLVIRDHKLNLVYYGYVDFFSDLGSERELILREVDVFSNFDNAEKLYSVDTLYISRDRYDLSIEIWEKQNDEEEEVE